MSRDCLGGRGGGGVLGGGGGGSILRPLVVATAKGCSTQATASLSLGVGDVVAGLGVGDVVAGLGVGDGVVCVVRTS